MDEPHFLLYCEAMTWTKFLILGAIFALASGGSLHAAKQKKVKLVAKSRWYAKVDEGSAYVFFLDDKSQMFAQAVKKKSRYLLVKNLYGEFKLKWSRIERLEKPEIPPPNEAEARSPKGELISAPIGVDSSLWTLRVATGAGYLGGDLRPKLAYQGVLSASLYRRFGLWELGEKVSYVATASERFAGFSHAGNISMAFSIPWRVSKLFTIIPQLGGGVEVGMVSATKNTYLEPLAELSAGIEFQITRNLALFWNNTGTWYFDKVSQIYVGKTLLGVSIKL